MKKKLIVLLYLVIELPILYLKMMSSFLISVSMILWSLTMTKTTKTGHVTGFQEVWFCCRRIMARPRGQYVFGSSGHLPQVQSSSSSGFTDPAGRPPFLPFSRAALCWASELTARIARAASEGLIFTLMILKACRVFFQFFSKSLYINLT